MTIGDEFMLGFLGGTGPAGRGLALRFALAGEKVILGSRNEERAKEAAETLSELIPEGSIEGATNRDAAMKSDIIFVVVPYDGQKATLEELVDELSGKVVVNVVAPIEFVSSMAKAVAVEEGCAALQAQKILPNSIVVAGFQNISAKDLLLADTSLDSDVVVCSDDEEAKQAVMKLADKLKGVRGIDGGHLENARYVEDFTALLLNINRIYKKRSKLKIGGI